MRTQIVRDKAARLLSDGLSHRLPIAIVVGIVQPRFGDAHSCFRPLMISV
jgi:hypothetical protein